MNIFEIISNVLIIEDEFDKEFAKQVLNIKKQISIGDVLSIKAQSFYVVKPLDTISSVAQKLNLTEKQVKSLAKSNHLFVGQKIEY